MTVPTGFTQVPKVPCAHIADYYQWLWEGHKCLAWQLLRRGYRQAATGIVEECNNLWEWN